MPSDPAQPKVIVVMPAYNAARTLVRTYRDIPPGVVDHVILVDDLSRDDTVAVAQLLDLQVVVHRQNLGYGGNQKTCYDTALAEGADPTRYFAEASSVNFRRSVVYGLSTLRTLGSHRRAQRR
jgi:glycosyltransferase involved in cell wall biosynthesis